MADYLDSLLAPPPVLAPQNTGDVVDQLLGSGAGATGSFANSGASGSFALQPDRPSGLVQGVRDTQNAAAQWLYNLLPKSAQSAGDNADHWLYDKSGGAIGTSPGLNFNQAVANQNKQYEAGLGSGHGIDWSRGLAGAGSQTALLGVTGLGSYGPAAAGLFAGALSPVTNLDNSNNSFGGQKAVQMGTGALIGTGLGALGNSVANVVSPKLAAAQQYLVDQGVPLTPGQMFGGTLKSIEDKLTSVPVFGEMIKSAQGRSTSGLNTAAYNQVLAPLKEAGFPVSIPNTAGRDAVDSISTQVSDAYNALIPKLSLTADSTLTGELNSLKQMATTGLAAPQAARFNSIMQNTVDQNFVNGTSQGKFLQGMLSDLGKQIKGYASDPSFENRQLADALKTVDQTIQSGLARSNPGFASTLSGINAAFANLARVQTAAGGVGASNGVFSANQLAAAVRGGDSTVRHNAYARGNALMQELSDSGKDILPQVVGNSGTADRAMTAGAMGALLASPWKTITNPAVWAAAVPSLAYTQAGSGLLNGFMGAARSPLQDEAANLLRIATQRGVQPAAATGVGLLSRQ